MNQQSYRTITELLPLLALYGHAGRCERMDAFLSAAAERTRSVTGARESLILLLECDRLNPAVACLPDAEPVLHEGLSSLPFRSQLEMRSPSEAEEFSAMARASLMATATNRGFQNPEFLELRSGSDLTGLVAILDPDSNSYSEQLAKSIGEILSAAIGNFQAFGQAKRHLARQSFLREVGAVFSGSGTLEEKIRNLLIRLNLLVRVEGCSLNVCDSKGAYDEVAISRGVAPELDAISGRLLLEVATRATLIHVEDLEQFFPTQGARGCYLGIPLIRREIMLGVLNIYGREPRVFSRKDIEFFASISEQIALNVDNARLLEQTQEQVDELSSVFRFSAILRREKTLPGIMRTVLKECVRSTGGDQGYMFFFEAAEQQLVPAASWGKGKALPPAAIPVRGEGYDYTELLSGIRYTDHPDQELPMLFRKSSLRDLPKHLKSWSLIPLRTDHQGLLGVLLVGRSGGNELGDDARRLLLTLTNVAENAIGRAMAFVEMQARVREEAASRAKSEFLAIMSHELRTPLTAILGFSEVLLGDHFGPLRDKQREYLQDILHNGEHLLELINDVLDLAKVEAGKVELSKESMDLRELFLEVECSLSSLAKIKKLDLVFSPLEMDVELVADRRRIKQILINLVSNAIKFTDCPGQVNVQAACRNGSVVLAVHDSGIGIGREDQERIFQPFGQVLHPGKSYQGTGLGLSLTRKLVELHGGQISVESAKGQGSKFSVELPRGVAE